MERTHITMWILPVFTACILAAGPMILPSARSTATPRPESAQQPSPMFRQYRHPVTTWVPPYAVAKSKAKITASFDGAGMKDAITHLALQFWTPTRSGGAELVKMEEVNDKTVIDLRDWCHANGIRVMLCVYNGVERWDWPLARVAFADHRDAFIKNLIAEMDRLKLDGIDIDLEGFDQDQKGKAPLDNDRKAFVSFMTALSKELHARNKHLTVSTLSYIWNAPNQTWWVDLLPLVDALNTMSYTDIGSTAPEWRAYAAQKKAAGSLASKLQIGMLSSKPLWQGNTVQQHIEWVQNDGGVGLAIWDAQLSDSAWQTATMWKAVRSISGIQGPAHLNE